MSNQYYSSCSLNCWDNCGLKVKIEDGKVTSIDGNKDHPITQGKICSRGRMLKDKTNSPDRLLYSLKKVNGQFVRISWEKALDEIALIMTQLKESVGTTAVLHSHDYANGGYLTNLDQRFFNCFGGVTEITGSICWGAGIEGQEWDFGDSYSHSPADLSNSKNIIVWGRNAARTNLHLYQSLLEAKRRGTNLYVIDPLYNATAKIADKHFTVKPGMDGILALGIIKKLFELNLADQKFIQNHTVGFPDLDALLQSISLEEVSQITEVSIEAMSELAKVYGNGPTATFLGLGMQRYANGGNTIRLIDALIAVSGNIGIPGGGANYASKQIVQNFQLDKITLSDRKTATRKFSMMKQAEELLSATEPKISMVFVTCGNPLTQVPDTSMVKKAFSSVNTIVVMDQFMTDTAMLADYILPVTTVFEVEDIYFSSMYHHFVNYAPKLVEAPGEVRSDLWIWSELAKRLGFGEDFCFTREEWLQLGLESLHDKGITLESLRENYFAELPVDAVPWNDFHFKTPSGKYEFTSSIAEKRGFDGKLKLALPYESKWTNKNLAERYPYSLLTIHPLRSNHSQHFSFLKGEKRLKVEISGNIADQLSLKNGDYVRVWNDRGEVRGYIYILKKAHPDTINIDEGLGSLYGGPVNLLTSNLESDNKLGSTLYDCLVNIEKI